MWLGNDDTLGAGSEKNEGSKAQCRVEIRIYRNRVYCS